MVTVENKLRIEELGRQVYIRRAGWKDLAAARELQELCFGGDSWPLLDMIAVLTMPSVVRYKVVDKGQMVGFVAGDIRRIEDTGWIAMICVHPDYRGLGLGRTLLERCEQKMGMPRVKLTVRASNVTAIDLYARNGYEEINRWAGYYKGGEAAIVMEKWLE